MATMGELNQHSADRPQADAVQSAPHGIPVIRTIAMPADTNPAGDIFGGWLMAQMDLAAGSVATRRARGRCATVMVEGMTFLSPVFVGDEVSLYAELANEGRSSMKIKVEAWRRHREEESLTRVTEAIFTFVAIGGDRRPRALPPADPAPRTTA
ncbi:MAG: acyl-CoA thioesterase [Methylocella sp.]